MLYRFFQQAPRFFVTTIVAAVCVGIYAATRIATGSGHMHAAEMLGYGEPQNFWKGELWRLPINSLHHTYFPRLLLGIAAFWYMGRLAELLMGPLRYAAFLILAAFFSNTAGDAAGENAAGLTGVVCAVFGLLLFIRPHNIVVTQMLPIPAIRALFLLLLLCVPLNFALAPDHQIPNVSHAAGLAYGLAFGWGLGVYRKPSRARRIALMGAHLLMIPGFVYLLNPVFNEQYVFNQGMLAYREGQPEQALEYFQRAARLNPEFALAHFNMGEIAYERKDYALASSAYGRFTAIDSDESDAMERMPEALEKRIKSLTALGQFDDASSALEQFRVADRSNFARLCAELSDELGPEEFRRRFPKAGAYYRLNGPISLPLRPINLPDRTRATDGN